MPEKQNEGEDESRQEDPTEEKKPEPSHIPDKNYMKLDRRLLRYWLPAIGVQAVTIYAIIVDCFNPLLGYAHPSLPQIQKATGFGNRTVQKAIRTLEDHGLIKVWRGGGHRKANRYIPLPAKVTDETIKLIQERGGEVIIDHLHLSPNPDDLPVSNDTGTETEDDDLPVSFDTGTETKGQNDRENGGLTGVKRHGGSVSNDTGTETYTREEEEEQQTTGNIVTTGKQESCHSEDVAVFSSNSSEESEIGKMVDALCEFENVEEPEARSAIQKLTQGYGVDTVDKQIRSALAQKEKIRNPVAWLISACKGNYEPGKQIAHPYEVKEPKSEEEIKADARELRQGASVSREEADRLAWEYESDYLRRWIRQVNRDAERGTIWGDFGSILVRGVESGREPEGFPPRE